MPQYEAQSESASSLEKNKIGVEAVAKAETFKELYLALERLGTVQGTKETFNWGQLVETIERVRTSKVPIGFVTRTFGIRDKVQELLDKEKREQSNSQP